ncbi:maltokinase N-terminal cap-like domain-containing protein [Streptomyces alkaliphilus]|uniref:maltokinase N-terminal cap-like domain-containing protein n=1 Tax=Streptomyces alkaliphilus TaxID=1472722 RepID=UPI00117CA865|nr:phosphotransferase [Streptomyces alkaliphilus]MQS07678.1 phosphotransferase [Streptomyces alkaliphilus]
MSESSPPRTAPSRTRPVGTPAGGVLLRSLTGLLARWLPSRRWYAGKGRPPGGLTLLSATELLPCTAGPQPGLLHLLVRVGPPGPRIAPVPVGPPGTPTGSRGEGDGDCYQLLLGVRPSLPSHLADAFVGIPAEGPLRGRAVYEALEDPRLVTLLLERLRAPGALGVLRFERAPDADIPSGLPGRLLGAEQSNSSVVYGNSHILKLFRRVSPGINPDLELSLALAEEGSTRVPPPAAWFEAELPGASEPVTLGVLQPFLAGSRDGWHLALASLEHRTDFESCARDLGVATAEVHTALARALPTGVLRRPQLEQAAAEMSQRLDAAAAAVPALRPHRAELRRTFDAVAEYGRRGGRLAAQRIHGDLHLGQVLLHEGRWSLIDFEGEPARPLAERRSPQPTIRDVAGMLRSFDYAAAQHPDPGPRGRRWARLCREAYCRGYAEGGGRDPLERPELLRAWETDKAVYEVLYEARHRPAWLHVPMAAIRRLAEEAAA